MKLNQNNKGIAAEMAAAHYLKQQGLTLLVQNFSCRFGEIDLIMRDQEVLVFIEVRLRTHASFSSAASSIDFHKQQKLIRTAHYYLQKHHQNSACRFDVILFSDQDYLSPEWIRNAIET